jgi:hypothetical protein
MAFAINSQLAGLRAYIGTPGNFSSIKNLKNGASCD